MEKIIMKIFFEYWLDNSTLPTHAKNLFAEAVLCYKNDANRAALLLSYIGFIEIIRKRLFESPKPSDISDNEWNAKLHLLLDDNIAEQTVFDLLLRSDNKYFKLNDSIRNQIRYWRDRRNDCAHLKRNSISTSHVESFWTFLMDNINKVVVSGSEQNLLIKISHHFDETYTPLDADITPLVHEIPQSIETPNFYSFLTSALQIIHKAQDDTLFYYIFDDAKFVYTIIKDLNDEYGEIAKSVILSDATLQENLFHSYPEYLTYFKDNTEFIRSAWKTNLAKSSTQKCAATLLRNSLIPQNEIKEFIRDCAYQNENSIPKDEDFIYLSSYGYREVIDEFFDKGTKESHAFNWWVAKNQKFIKFYIKQNLIEKNDSFIDMLLSNYNSSKQNSENANIIYTSLSTLMNDIPDFMEYVQTRANHLSFDIDNIVFFF